MIYLWLCWDFIVAFIKFGLPVLANSATFKKTLGMGLGLGISVSAVYAAAIKESKEIVKAEVTKIEEKQDALWKAHLERGDIILKSLDENISSLKNDVHSTKNHVGWLYRNEINKK